MFSKLPRVPSKYYEKQNYYTCLAWVYENWSKDKLVAILKNKYRPHPHPHLHPHAHPHPHPHPGT